MSNSEIDPIFAAGGSELRVIDLINIAECSEVTKTLIRQLIARDAHGKEKYGVTLDRKDLTPQQWLQHMTEELLDGAGYAQAVLRELPDVSVTVVTDPT